MLSMGVYKTRNWQTSRRIVQDFNVCSVIYYGPSVKERINLNLLGEKICLNLFSLPFIGGENKFKYIFSPQ